MTTTANLALPYIEPNQAQKHVTLNTALGMLDAVIQIGVRSRSIVAPPLNPRNGERFIPASEAEAAWAGHVGEMAIYQDGAWSFIPPQGGWLVFVEDENALIVRDGSSWRNVIASALNPIGQIGINATASAINRLTVSSDATLFDHDGEGHQLKLNKVNTGETTSCLFQSGYSGRAEVGLIDTDDLSFKVSSNGIDFETALTLKTDTGFAGLGTDVPASRLHVQQDHDARLTIDTVQSGAGGGFDILNSTDGQNWRVTGSPSNFKVRDHTAMLDKFLVMPGASGIGAIMNTPRFGIGTTSPTAQLHVNGPVRIGAYAKADLPDAATTGAGAIVLVTDEASGVVLAFSDGAEWRRVTDRATVA